ncbi:hypothetical protein J6590_074247 [Homalodisca vitripennis]|nr:hypothetical protein J6590_074247 [Homalodisca vitripennis]
MKDSYPGFEAAILGPVVTSTVIYLPHHSLIPCTPRGRHLCYLCSAIAQSSMQHINCSTTLKISFCKMDRRNEGKRQNPDRDDLRNQPASSSTMSSGTSGASGEASKTSSQSSTQSSDHPAVY